MKLYLLSELDGVAVVYSAIHNRSIRHEKTLILASILLATVGSAAVAQSTAEKTGVNSVMGVAPKTEDFVLEAASSDMFEIESSKLALERSDEKTKAFAPMRREWPPGMSGAMRRSSRICWPSSKPRQNSMPRHAM
jgi:hypothetical protein